MHRIYLTVLTLILTILHFKTALAQLDISTIGTASVDFDLVVTGVVNGPYDGTGLASMPALGQLDADGVSFTGFSNTSGGSANAMATILPADAVFAVIDNSPGLDTWLGLSPGGVD